MSNLFDIAEQQQSKATAEAPRADDDVVRELAGLSSLEYEQQRTPAAELLGVRVSVLDSLVRNQAGHDDQDDEIVSEVDPWAESVNGADLLSEAESIISGYMALPHGAAASAALWALHTHCYECFEHTPRINISAPEKGCGKTTMLDIIATLVPRVIKTENVTTAVVFRLIDGHRPTLLIDEYDSFLGNNDELRGALNAGHKVGGAMMRCEGDDHKIKKFKTFAPVALAGIGGLPGTLHDRSIIVHLQRALPGEIKKQFDSRRINTERTLCRKMARWAIDNDRALKNADPDMDGLFNRVADNWRPLFAIADQAGGDWPERARYLSKTINPDDEIETKGEILLKDVQEIFSRYEGDKMFSADLVDKLIYIEDSPWSDWRHGRPISQNSVAHILKPYGIRSKDVRIYGKVKKGYDKSDFDDALSRYTPV